LGILLEFRGVKLSLANLREQFFVPLAGETRVVKIVP